MFLDNVRFGFATNSSSTHSIIITKKQVSDDLEDYFGWDYFTASSQQAKRQYLAGILRYHLEPLVGRIITHDLILYWLDVDIFNESLCIGIDHQSMPCLPRLWEGHGLDLDFFNDYKDFLLNEHVVIIGGNDNDDEKHPLEKGNRSFVLPLFYEESGVIVARKDVKYNYWSLYNRRTGTKIRLALDKKQPAITKGFAPELVDLKITDYCPKKCAFCYQNSTVNGLHGNMDYITSVLDCLSQHHVFEVAIGGGEPIDHPQFIEILQKCKYYHIVPNFTTKNITWLSDDKKRQAILENIGGFSYSIDCDRDVRKLGFLLEQYGIDKHRIQVQIVEGVLSEYLFTKVLEECSYHNITLTILGFKTTGRGDSFLQKHNINTFNWFDLVKKMQKKGHYVSIGIDTVIAQKYSDELKNQGINGLFYTKKEGQFSCYIDGVTQQIGPCSYEPHNMKNFNKTCFNDFLDYFSEF